MDHAALVLDSLNRVVAMQPLEGGDEAAMRRAARRFGRRTGHRAGARNPGRLRSLFVVRLHPKGGAVSVARFERGAWHGTAGTFSEHPSWKWSRGDLPAPGRGSEAA